MPSGSPWSALDRPPLSGKRLARDLADVWREVRVVEVTESTNADVAAAAADGAAEGLVVIAEEQRSGRGRMARSWAAPARSSLLLSVLLRPDLPMTALPLVPLVAGLAAAEAVRGVGHVAAGLKWPNDLLVADRKLGGILVERLTDGAVVVGIGLNVTTTAGELAALPAATSVALEGGVTDREPLVKELLRALSRRYRAYVDGGGSPSTVLPPYREICETIGRRVVVHLPGGRTASGTAVSVADSGALVVRDDDGIDSAWSAGDVVHVRTEG